MGGCVEETEELSTLEGVGDVGCRGGWGVLGEETEGELGLSLLWLSVLPPDRHDRACNQNDHKDSQTAIHMMLHTEFKIRQCVLLYINCSHLSILENPFLKSM